MLQKLLKRLHNQKGAMDKILVTLLLVIIGVGAVVGLSGWYSDQKNAMKNQANTSISNATADAEN